MPPVVIKAENVAKRYVLGSPRQKSNSDQTLIEYLYERVSNPRALLSGRDDREFWALGGVSFEVHQGAAVGVIGRNGAGKSTLLKVLSRITEPTRGRIEISGRIASLLEVGTGFHPELSGRENIFLNGAILGMTRREVQRKFDEIVEFADVLKFLDTPVKRYSSGMYVRLAFAVAAHLEPEILVVDEVLAVGDAGFQRKCLGKMQTVAHEGRTVLFVSHNMQAIEQLTSTAILLSGGLVRYIGPTSRAIEAYLEVNASGDIFSYDVELVPRKYRGTEKARFTRVSFAGDTATFDFGESICFNCEIACFEDLTDCRISLTIFSSDGASVGSCFGPQVINAIKDSKCVVQVEVPSMGLAPGSYHFGLSIGAGNNHTGHLDHDTILDVLSFAIRPEVSAFGTVAEWQRLWGNIVIPRIITRNVC
jgi:lipopolysaccharide transport system ATP-binding protein